MKEKLKKLLLNCNFYERDVKPDEYICGRNHFIRAIITDSALFYGTYNPKVKTKCYDLTKYEDLGEIERILKLNS